MFKKYLSITIMLVMAFSFSNLNASAFEAIPTTSTVLVNGENVAFDAYFINDNNYFKLRDLAYILNGTEKQFSIVWDGEANAISLTSGQLYIASGDEMKSKGDGVKTPIPTDSKILLDGAKVEFTAYNIENNNYFKLRDIGKVLNFSVEWDEDRDTIVIDTRKGYISEDAKDTEITGNQKEQEEPETPESETTPEQPLKVPVSQATTLSAGLAHTVGLRSSGAVVAVGHNRFGQCDVSGWRKIVAVAADSRYTVGLRSDGTVVITDSHSPSGRDVSDWKDIVAISASLGRIAGLRADGTVVATEGDIAVAAWHDVSDWEDIVAISVGGMHTVGLRSDGTIVATENSFGRDVLDWQDIVAISAGLSHTVGLRSDGTVVATGVGNNFDSGQCDVQNWRDIIAVSAGVSHTVGLRSDGTVVAVGNNTYGQCDVSDWQDIVAVSAGGSHTVGLRSDGKVVAVGDNEMHQCNVSEWRSIKLP